MEGAIVDIIAVQMTINRLIDETINQIRYKETQLLINNSYPIVTNMFKKLIVTLLSTVEQKTAMWIIERVIDEFEPETEKATPPPSQTHQIDQENSREGYDTSGRYEIIEIESSDCSVDFVTYNSPSAEEIEDEDEE